MPRYSNPASQKLPALCAHARWHLAPGGNGYIEESPMPYVYRQAPLKAIWEGSGNVICLDVLRPPSPTRDASPCSSTKSPKVS